MAAYPPRFGPVLWKVIHLHGKRLDFLTLMDYKTTQEKQTEDEGVQAAPEKARDRAVLWRFLNELDAHLPCKGCSLNFLAFLAENPLPEYEVHPSREPKKNEFFHWTVDLHNHANDKTGKRTFTYEEAEAQFEKDWMSKDENLRLEQAQKYRLEDHAKIKQLEDDIAQLESGVVPVNMYLAIALAVMTLIAIVAVIAWIRAR